MDWWYTTLILFIFIRLQLCCDWYGPLMVVVLCALIAINVALSVLHYVLWWSWPCRHYLKYYDDLCSWFIWSMIIFIYLRLRWNYVFFYCFCYMIMLDYDYVFICAVLELVHNCSYLTIWVYNVYVNDVIVVYDMA